MANILTDLLESAQPWYIKYWRSIALAGLSVCIGGYVALLHHRLSDQDQVLKEANDQLVRITTQYQDDIRQMRSALEKQNAAVSEMETQTEVASEQIAASNTKASKFRPVVDKQVDKILNQPKPTDADSAISSLVLGVPNLRWEQLK